MTELEHLEKNVEDAKAAASNATDRADAVEAVSAYVKAKQELKEYLGTSAMTDEEKEQFYWDNPEAIPDKEQDNAK